VKARCSWKGEYPPSFPLRLMHKDVGWRLDLAREAGITLPAAAAAYSTYSAVKAEAKEDLDYAAGDEVLEALSAGRIQEHNLGCSVSH